MEIRECARLKVTDTGEDMLLKPKTTTMDLAGSGASHSTPKEMKNLLDRLRER